MGKLGIESNSPFCCNLKQFPGLNQTLEEELLTFDFFLLYIWNILKSELVLLKFSEN